ncbi:MAG: NAD-dependent epimerase/dehydratase family protein [Chloroflexi bacterium]|nr:NAD-dependent epimerase/dehydratase family protein [Chloroflexota bacterium]
MVKALITGGAGFIGSHLAEALLERNDEVAVVDDLSTGSLDNIAHLTANPRFQFAITGITNELVMDRLINQCDVIFHLAAAVGVELIVRDPVRVIESNIKGCETVLRIAARYRKKVLLASTSEVYGKSERVPFREDSDSVLGPTSISRWSYACSKAMDEFLALAYYKQFDLPVVLMRFFNTVGPRQTGRYGMVVPRFVRRALAGEPLEVYGDGQQSRCFTDVSDVTRAVIALAETPAAIGEAFNIGSTQEVSIEQLARLTVAMCQSSSEIRYIPYDEAYEPGFEDLRRRVPDTSKIRRTIAWQPEHDLAAILERVITYYRSLAASG